MMCEWWKIVRRRKGAAMKNGVVTMEEIKARFDSQWVLLEDPETDEYLEVKSGKLISHSKDKRRVVRAGLRIPPPRHLALLYIGELFDGTEFEL
jgi:hypothetical protein